MLSILLSILLLLLLLLAFGLRHRESPSPAESKNRHTASFIHPHADGWHGWPSTSAEVEALRPSSEASQGS